MHEEGGCDVEKIYTRQVQALPNARPRNRENAIVSVFGGGTGMELRDEVGPEMVRMKAMVGEKEHGGAFFGCGVRFGDQRSEHLVMQLIAGLQHMLVEGEIVFGDGGSARRVEPHERVAEVIDRVKVDGAQIPGLAVHQPRGSGVDVGALGYDARSGVQTAIPQLIDRESLRHQEFEQVGRELFGIEAEGCQRLAEFRRMDHACDQFEIRRNALKLIRHHDAANRFGGITGPPAHDDTAESALAEDVPYSLGFPRKLGDALYAAPVWPWFGEAVNTVSERPLTCCDGGPQHRRKRRLKCGDLRGAAMADEAAEMGHFAGVQEGMDDFPIGLNPAHEQNLAAGIFVVSNAGP